MTEKNQTLEIVKEYYGIILRSNRDLKTDACCMPAAFPPRVREIVDQIHPEVLEKFYGCGSPIPALLDGKTILDLGCGAGRDAFILSKLVGPEGRVIGVDMTEEQLSLARKHAGDYPNTLFLQGFMEDLEGLRIGNNSVDVVVSNCVINLSPDKRRVFSEIFRVLKDGGELYFADIFAERRVPQGLVEDPVMLGECLGGAMYIEDFRRLLTDLGYPDYRLVTRRRVALQNPEIREKAGEIPFFSATIRAFKLPLEDRCEDYGQVAFYRGTIPECPHAFPLDDHHLFEKDRPVPVCGNTAAMLSQTRYAPHFRIEGEGRRHFGLFECGEKEPEPDGTQGKQGCC